MDRDLYAILGVPADATGEQIKAAFRKLTREHHPDVLVTDSERGRATEKMQELTQAYRVLRDPVKRLAYDARCLDSYTQQRTRRARMTWSWRQQDRNAKTSGHGAATGSAAWLIGAIILYMLLGLVFELLRMLRLL